jgi:hypothetical protein
MDGVIAECRSYDELVRGLRARIAELNVRCEDIDDAAGLPSRYCAKLVAPIPVRSVGRTSLSLLLRVLGLKLVLAVDGEVPRLIREQRRNAGKRMLADGKPRSQRPRHVWPFSDPAAARRARAIQLLGQSKRKRRLVARIAANARWRNGAGHHESVTPTEGGSPTP